MKKFIEKNYFNISYIYILVVTFYCIARLIVPIQFISANIYFTVFMTVFGVILGLYNIFVKKSYINTKYIVYLILFSIFNIFTIISVLKYGYINNLKHAAVFFIYFFVIYTTYFLINNEQRNRLYNGVFSLISLIHTLGVFISIIQFILLINYRVIDYRGISIRQGFMESRLFGILASPNYMSVISLVVIVYLIYYCKINSRGKIINYTIYFMISLNYIYIVLSGSRTTFVSLLVISFIYSIYVHYRDNKLKYILNIILTIIVVLSSYYSIKSISNFYLKHTSNMTININDDNLEKEEISLDREDTSERNISNNRFAIWQGTLDMVPNKPILGVSSGYWHQVGKDYDSSNYIIEQEYLPHNGYIELLFYNGISGFIFIGLFIIRSIYLMITRLKNNYKSIIFYDKLFVFLAVIVILTSNLFLSSTLYGMMLLGVILFSLLGYFNSKYVNDYQGFRKINIDEVKNIELEILKYIHNISENNNIKYHLAYGTLLGAVRHKGFIPWDDDIDISLLRQDYEKLYEVINKDNNSTYKVISYKNSDKYNLPFYRVYDTRTFYNNNYLKYDNFKLGICVDVFPFDYYEDISTQISKYDKFRQLSSYSFYGIRNDNQNELKNITRYILSSIFSIFKVSLWNKKIDSLAKSTKKSKYVDYLMEVKKYDTKLDISYFKESINIEFEEYSFKAPKEYHNILVKLYGENYMDIPKEEDRVSHADFDAYIKESY